MHTYSILHWLEINHEYDPSLDVKPLRVINKIIKLAGKVKHRFAGDYGVWFSFCPLNKGYWNI